MPKKEEINQTQLKMEKIPRTKNREPSKSKRQKKGQKDVRTQYTTYNMRMGGKGGK